MPAGVLVVHNAEAREAVGERAACLDVLDVQVAVVIRGVGCIGREGRRRDAVEVGEAAVGGDEHDVLELGGVGPGAGEVGGVPAVCVAGRVESVEQFVYIRIWRVVGHGRVRVCVYIQAWKLVRLARLARLARLGRVGKAGWAGNCGQWCEISTRV